MNLHLPIHALATLCFLDDKQLLRVTSSKDIGTSVCKHQACAAAHLHTLTGDNLDGQVVSNGGKLLEEDHSPVAGLACRAASESELVCKTGCSRAVTPANAIATATRGSERARWKAKLRQATLFCPGPHRKWTQPGHSTAYACINPSTECQSCHMHVRRLCKLQCNMFYALSKLFPFCGS